jgi:7-cyano-7-deazaguanine synthase
MNKAVVILSGGQDSTYCAAWAKTQKYDEVIAISFDYGQRHSRELQSASNICRLLGIQHEIITLGEGILAGTSPLTNKDQELEQYQNYKEMDAIIGDRIEKTFVPMRNALFLTIGANRAVVAGANRLITGVCEQDNANYPDCREQFILQQEMTINEALGFKYQDSRTIIIEAPLLEKSKAESIMDMIALGFYPLLAFTHTAYDGQYPPLGQDHATLLRAQGFVEAGVPDPLMVRAFMEGKLPLGYPGTPNYQNHIGSEFLAQLIHDIRLMSANLIKEGVIL